MSAMSTSETAALPVPVGDRAPIGLRLHVETPENIVLDYQLAGPAARLGAYLLDLVIRGVAFLVVGFALRAAGAITGLVGTTWGLLLVLWFLNSWGYYVISEGFFRGKSIGKHALGLRVVHERGHPLTFWGAMLRNLLRWPDSLPAGLHAVAFTSALLTRRFQRLGDLVAGTVVISERRIVLPRQPVILEKIRPLPRQEIGGYLPDDRVLSTIEEFLGRGEFLKNRPGEDSAEFYERGHALAAIIARPLARRLNYTGETHQLENYPMAFLARVYVTLLERREEAEELE